jgi:hypothetical protein
MCCCGEEDRAVASRGRITAVSRFDSSMAKMLAPCAPALSRS